MTKSKPKSKPTNPQAFEAFNITDGKKMFAVTSKAVSQAQKLLAETFIYATGHALVHGGTELMTQTFAIASGSQKTCKAFIRLINDTNVSGKIEPQSANVFGFSDGKFLIKKGRLSARQFFTGEIIKDADDQDAVTKLLSEIWTAALVAENKADDKPDPTDFEIIAKAVASMRRQLGKVSESNTMAKDFLSKLDTMQVQIDAITSQAATVNQQDAMVAAAPPEGTAH